MRFIQPMTRPSIRLLGMLALIGGIACAEPAPRLNPARFINQDNESSAVNDIRHIKMVEAIRKDMGMK